MPLTVAKQELLDYKDAQTMEIKENISPSSSAQQDIKTPSDTGDERRTRRPNPPPSPSDDVPTEDEVNKESTEEPVDEIESETESVSTKESNDENNFTDSSSLDPTIQKAFMDASLGDFTKSLEQKIIAIVTDNNVKNQSRN